MARELSASRTALSRDLPSAADSGAARDAERTWEPLAGDPLRRRMLALADIGAGLVVALFLGLVEGGETALWSALFLPTWLVLAKLYGLYDRDHRTLRHLTVDELPSLLLWALTGTLLLAGFLLVTPGRSLGFAGAAAVWLLAWGAAAVLRAVARFAWRRVTPPERTLILGTGPLADATRRKLELFPDIHVDVVGERDGDSIRDLLAAEEPIDGVDRVILAAQTLDEQLIADLVLFCREHRVKLSVIPPARGMFGTAVQLRHVADLPVVEYNTWDVSRSTLLLKRTLDVGVSAVALVLLAPLFALIALAIRLDSRGPAFFSQLRAGRNGEPFRMYKFRTMVADAEQQLPGLVGPLEDLADPMLSKLPDDPRVTRVGRFLRRASLDELPQLVNVLKGNMSLVGPRPERPELVARYRPEHRFRLEVRPGLTGPMQVFGRGHLTFDERLAVDRDYVENLSFGRDFRILALTFAAVVSGRGAF
jgi:exopolysaccharide biosynthesis polyprenyl glycosylphosphotransferase